MTTREMTEEEQEERVRGYRHGEIPRRPEDNASDAYMGGYWAALRGSEEPKEVGLKERVAEYKVRKHPRLV